MFIDGHLILDDHAFHPEYAGKVIGNIRALSGPGDPSRPSSGTPEHFHPSRPPYKAASPRWTDPECPGREA